MREANLIINADDYGRSTSINKAIRKSFELGLITDTSIMVTCEEGLSELKQKGNLDCLKGSAGCHLSVTLGRPITDAVKKLPLVDNSGCYLEQKKDLFIFGKNERRLLYDEFMAQIDIVQNQLGLKITHLDSHQHVHMRLDYLPIVVKVCKDAKIPYLRIPSCAKTTSFKSKIATRLKIGYFKMNGIKVVDFFGSPEQILISADSSMKNVELMCHPMFNSKHEIVNKVKVKIADECEPLSSQVSHFLNYSFVGFDSIIE